MNRHGVMYTLVAIVMLIVIGSVFFTQTRRTGFEASSASADRVRSLNAFIHSLETDSERASYIAGFRSFIAMEQYVTSTGLFLPNPEVTFREAFLNGTIGGSPYIIMENSSFNGYITRVQQTAAAQGIAVTATVSQVSLWQTDPWNVLVNYTLTMNVTDNRGVASWNINKTLTGKIPILDLRDPIFTARTYGRIQRVIKPTNVTLFVNDTNNANDTTGIMRHFNASSYLAAARGPSMLMRFAGNFSDSPYGIESLVDTDDFTAQGLIVDSTLSSVDYLYFNNSKATACSIQNLPTRLKLDADHLSVYQVQGQLTYSACP